MKKLLRGILGGLVTVSFALTLGACSDPPPPVDPPEPMPEPEPPPPPPKPTCEAMKDKCTADADTVARIPGVDHGFTPPAGWEYAMLEEATVTQQSDEGAVLVVTSMKHEKTSYKAKPLRTAKVNDLAELVDITPPKRLSFDRPNKRKLSEMSMTLWENEAKRGKKKGALLLLSAVVGDREIFGIAYAPADDMDGTKAILGSLETFKPVDDGKAEKESDEGEQEGGSGKKK